MPLPNPTPSQLDQTQILQRVFDQSTDQLRADCNITLDQISGEVNVELDAADGDNVAISDGVNTVTTTNVGGKTGLDVNVLNANINIDISSPGIVVSTFNEVTSISSSVLTTIVSYTVPVGKQGFLERCIVSGTNIATYSVQVNASIIDKKRTMFGGNLNEEFLFYSRDKNGLPLSAGDLIQIKVIHERNSSGDFNGRIQVTEI